MKPAGAVTMVIVGMVLAVTMPVWGDTKSKKEEAEEKGKAEMAAAAKVTIDQAIKAASEKVPGKVIEAELEQKRGKTVWEVEVVTAEGKVVEVHVDSETGTVIATEEKRAEKKGEKKSERRKEKPKK